MQARLQLRVADLLPLEVLGQHVLVRVRGCLQQLIPPARDLLGHLLGHRHLLPPATIEDVCPAVHQVDVPPERVGRPDGDLQRRDLGAESRSQRIQRRVGVGVLPVAAREHEESRGVRLPAQGDGLLRARLNATRGVHRKQRPVGRREALDHLAHEVGVAGRVDKRDAVPLGLQARDRKGERELALLLLRLVVQAGRPVVDLAQSRYGARLEEQMLGQGRLAGAGVARQDDVAQVRELFGRHATRAPPGEVSA